MNTGELSNEQKRLVWRYVEVWRRFRQPLDRYRSFAKLDDDLGQGPACRGQGDVRHRLRCQRPQFLPCNLPR